MVGLLGIQMALENHTIWHPTSVRVVSIGRLTAFYVIFIPMECLPSKPPHYAIMHQSCSLIYRYLWFCKISNLKSGTFLLSTKRNDDVRARGRFTQNMLHWNENDIKSSQPTIGDYCSSMRILSKFGIQIPL